MVGNDVLSPFINLLICCATSPENAVMGMFLPSFAVNINIPCNPCGSTNPTSVIFTLIYFVISFKLFLKIYFIYFI